MKTKSIETKRPQEIEDGTGEIKQLKKMLEEMAEAMTHGLSFGECYCGDHGMMNGIIGDKCGYCESNGEIIKSLTKYNKMKVE